MLVNDDRVAPSPREVILVASEGSFERLLRIKLKGFYFSTYDIVNWMIDQQRAGADGVVPVTRWSSLTIDIENEKEPIWRRPGIGGPWSVPIMNGLIFRMRNAKQPISYIFQDSSEQFLDTVPVTVPIIPSGGVRSGSDVIGYLIAGGNAAEICAQVILEGTRVAERVEREIYEWMEQKGYHNIGEFQGSLRLMEHAKAKDIPQWIPVVDETTCTACERCVQACPNGAIKLLDDCASIDQDYCEGCRTCYYICPAGAISLHYCPVNNQIILTGYRSTHWKYCTLRL